MLRRNALPRRSGAIALRPSTGISVIVADADQFVRAGTRVLLEESGFEVVAEAADASTAIAEAIARRPAVCLLDQDLPGGAVVATREVASLLPDTAVVIVAGSVDRDAVLDALRAGAQGYLLKSGDGSALPQALRSAAAGEAVMSRLLVSTVLGALGENGDSHATLADGRDVQLTAREQDVARLLPAGMETAEMAATLGIAPPTVRRHVSTLLHKLGARDRDVAVALLVTGREPRRRGSLGTRVRREGA
ncbi:MAG TPA: response regulator transcription factor [Gaiellaceae bacterium]|nr:response regulator transcription factor [Gaiellaceae bacterium]